LLEAWNRGCYPAAIYLLHEFYIGLYTDSFGDGVYAWVVHVITKRYWSILNGTLQLHDIFNVNEFALFLLAAGIAIFGIRNGY